MAEKALNFPERPRRGQHYRGDKGEARGPRLRGQLPRAGPRDDDGPGHRGGGAPGGALERRGQD